MWIKFFWIIALLVAVVAIYFLVVRDWAKAKSPWIAERYDELDKWYKKIWLLMKKAWGTTAMFVAMLLPEIPQLLTELNAIDLSQFLPQAWVVRVSQLLVLVGIIVRFTIPKYTKRG